MPKLVAGAFTQVCTRTVGRGTSNVLLVVVGAKLAIAELAREGGLAPAVAQLVPALRWSKLAVPGWPLPVPSLQSSRRAKMLADSPRSALFAVVRRKTAESTVAP